MGSNTVYVTDAADAERKLYEEFVIHAPREGRKDVEREVNRVIRRLEYGDTKIYNDYLGCWIQVGELI